MTYTSVFIQGWLFWCFWKSSIEFCVLRRPCRPFRWFLLSRTLFVLCELAKSLERGTLSKGVCLKIITQHWNSGMVFLSSLGGLCPNACLTYNLRNLWTFQNFWRHFLLEASFCYLLIVLSMMTLWFKDCLLSDSRSLLRENHIFEPQRRDLSKFIHIG